MLGGTSGTFGRAVAFSTGGLGLNPRHLNIHQLLEYFSNKGREKGFEK